MSHFFIRPGYSSEYPPAMIYADARVLSDNYARIWDAYNGGLHNVNMSPEQNDPLSENYVKFDWGAYPPAMVGTRHSHDGWGSAAIGAEAITFDQIGGAFAYNATNPRSNGIVFSGMDRLTMVVHTGSVYFDVLTPNTAVYTRSVQDGGFYRTIAVPFNGPKWGGSAVGAIPANSQSNGATRLFLSLRANAGWENQTHSLRSNLWASMFSWTAVNQGGIQVSSYITVWTNNRDSSALYRDVWVDWVLVALVK